MSSVSPLARVNASSLKDHVDKRILLIGKVDSQNGSEATFQLSDGTANIHVGSAITSLELGAIYQVLGQVSDDNSVKAFQVTKLDTTSLPPKEFEDRLYALRNGPA